jgi:hypothetical protein
LTIGSVNEAPLLVANTDASHPIGIRFREAKPTLAVPLYCRGARPA